MKNSEVKRDTKSLQEQGRKEKNSSTAGAGAAEKPANKRLHKEELDITV